MSQNRYQLPAEKSGTHEIEEKYTRPVQDGVQKVKSHGIQNGYYFMYGTQIVSVLLRRMQLLIDCSINSGHNSAMFQFLHSCQAFKFLFSLNNLPGCFNDNADVTNLTSHVHQTILNHATITACNTNYKQLCFLESLLIKRYIPQLKYDIKSDKELALF